MTILGCAGSDEPGANFTPPTLGNFMKKQALESKRLREAKAGQQVIREAREFHEHQARKYGINTNRGLAHFRASKMFTREGNRLQEMFDQGGQDHSELPPKAVMKASKAAMLFHKKQAEKAGLDSDLGHAHVAAMEHHADIHKKAKQQHKQAHAQQQPMQASAEGGPGSGPRSKERVERAEKYKKQMKGKPSSYGEWIQSLSDGRRNRAEKSGKREALPGHGSKQSPVPVPKKSEQPSEDVRDPNKPPVQLNPQDANKPMRRLQQGEEGGPGSGPQGGKSSKPSAAKVAKDTAKAAAFLSKVPGFHSTATMANRISQQIKKEGVVSDQSAKSLQQLYMKGNDALERHEDRYGQTNKSDRALEHISNLSDHAEAYGWNIASDGSGRIYKEKAPKKESRASVIANFGRESGKHVRRGPDFDMERSDPKGAGTLMDDDLIYRGPRTKEARRSLRRPIWETDDSERDRSDSGLTA